MRKVLVLAVHPDDETLGCGGALLKHKAAGDQIYWLIGTRIKEEDGFTKERIAERQLEIEEVNQKFGFDGVTQLDLSTMKVDQVAMQDLVNEIADVFNKIKPDIIYLPFMKDSHSDHRVLFEAAHSCTKTFRFPFVKKVLMMETISETEFGATAPETVFLPNYFVDISEYFEKKIDIMKTYKSEMGNHPFPRSEENIKALATYRGATAGCQFAESFMVLKEVA